MIRQHVKPTEFLPRSGVFGRCFWSCMRSILKQIAKDTWGTRTPVNQIRPSLFLSWPPSSISCETMTAETLLRIRECHESHVYCEVRKTPTSFLMRWEEEGGGEKGDAPPCSSLWNSLLHCVKFIDLRFDAWCLICLGFLFSSSSSFNFFFWR